jgi:SNF2 family DNA or RNA helicase
MAKVNFTCPVCNAKSHEKAHIQMTSGSMLVFLSCGHKFAISPQKYALESQPYETLTATDGSKLYPFQVKTCEFLEKANFRAHVGHDMRLGKTMCALAPVKFNKKLLPVLIVCKANLIRQMERAIHNWIGPDQFVQCLTKGSDVVIPKLPEFYVCSFDLLEKHYEALNKQVRYIIIDESQLIKNMDTSRYKYVQEVQKGIPHVVTLSGTQIENNMMEYFPVLNLLNPSRFWSQEDFIRSYVSYYTNGYGQRKLGGLRRSSERAFRRQTEDFVIRYRRDEVEIEFPTIAKRHSFLDIPDSLRKEYEKIFGEMEDYIAENNVDLENLGKHVNNLLAFIAKLRHVTGKAKVDYIVDWINDYHEAFPDERLTIFVHHRAVGEMLHKAIPHAIRISDTDDLTSRDNKLQQFIKTPGAIFIIRTLAEGVGLNFEGSCTNGILMEREFNPSKEEQAISRFADAKAAGKKVNVLYPIATDSIDEWLTELVERKREGVDGTLNGWDKTTEATNTEVMQGLLNIVKSRGKRVRVV